MAVDTESEQRVFHDTTLKFLEKTGSPAHARDLAEQGTAFERSWWSQAAELGWTSLLVPESRGGGSITGQGMVDLAELVELIGAHVAPGPTNVVNVVIAGLVHSRAIGGHDQLLADLLGGERVAGWAVQPPGVVFDPSAPGVAAVPTASGWRLNGRAEAVEFGAQADVVLVAARTNAGVIEVLVDASAPGLAIRPRGSVDLVRDFADITLTDVDASALVADSRSGADVIAHQVRVMNVLQAAEAVGAVGAVFDLALEWGFDRYSFGRPLASYQALKHRYADMFTWLQGARAITAGAAHAVQDDAPDAQRIVSAAKSYTGDKCAAIIQDCAQLYGGLSQTMEHDLHLYLRRALLSRNLYGSPREHRLRLAPAPSPSSGTSQPGGTAQSCGASQPDNDARSAA